LAGQPEGRLLFTWRTEEELEIILKRIFIKQVGENWNYLCQVRDKWWVVLITVMNFWVP